LERLPQALRSPHRDGAAAYHLGVPFDSLQLNGLASALTSWHQLVAVLVSHPFIVFGLILERWIGLLLLAGFCQAMLTDLQPRAI